MTREQFAMQLEELQGQVAALEATKGHEIPSLYAGQPPSSLRDAIIGARIKLDELLDVFMNDPPRFHGQGADVVAAHRRLDALEVARYPAPATPTAEIDAVKALQERQVTVKRGPDGR